jgi:hypothetical protein
VGSGLPAVRAMRAAVFAGVSLALSAGGQVLVTHAPLPFATVLWAWLAVFALALLLTGAERGFARIAAVLVPLELALNAMFNLGQQSCGPAVPTTPSTGLVGGLPTLLLCGRGSVPVHTAAAGSGPLGGLFRLTLPADPTAWQFSLLLVVHLMAALLAAAWLRRGEAAVFRTLLAVALSATAPLRVLFAVLTPPVQAGVAIPAAPRRSQPGPQQVLLRTARRRGPPLCSAVC